MRCLLCLYYIRRTMVALHFLERDSGDESISSRISLYLFCCRYLLLLLTVLCIFIFDYLYYTTVCCMYIYVSLFELYSQQTHHQHIDSSPSYKHNTQVSRSSSTKLRSLCNIYIHSSYTP